MEILSGSFYTNLFLEFLSYTLIDRLQSVSYGVPFGYTLIDRLQSVSYGVPFGYAQPVTH